MRKTTRRASSGGAQHPMDAQNFQGTDEEKRQQAAIESKIWQMERELNAAKTLAQRYEDGGQRQKAYELRDHIERGRQKLRNMRKKREAGPQPLDFSTPDAAMIAEAKEHGIDLSDPQVRAELMRLQQEKVSGGLPGGGGGGGGGGRSLEGMPKLSVEDVGRMTEDDMRRLLNAAGKSHDGITEMPALRGLVVHTLREQGQMLDFGETGGGGGAKRARAVGKSEEWTPTAKMIAAAAFLFLVYRFYAIGAFSMFGKVLGVTPMGDADRGPGRRGGGGDFHPQGGGRSEFSDYDEL